MRQLLGPGPLHVLQVESQRKHLEPTRYMPCLQVVQAVPSWTVGLQYRQFGWHSMHSPVVVSMYSYLSQIIVHMLVAALKVNPI